MATQPLGDFTWEGAIGFRAISHRERPGLASPDTGLGCMALALRRAMRAGWLRLRAGSPDSATFSPTAVFWPHAQPTRLRGAAGEAVDGRFV